MYNVKQFEKKLNKAYCCDCIKIMKKIPDESIDLILTDPPYGIHYTDGIALHFLKGMKNNNIENIDWKEFFDQSDRILKEEKMLYFCCRADMIMKIGSIILSSKFKYAHDFVWFKGDMGYGNLNIMGTTHELIVGLSKGSAEKSREMLINGKIKKRVPAYYIGKLLKIEYYNHPTQKPIKMMKYIILNRTDKNDIIADFFCGSGTTLVAAKELRRRFIGFDIDKKYVNITKKRLNKIV